MPRCCYYYWSALTCSSALVKMHLMSLTFAVVIIKALLVMCWDSGGSWNLCLYKGGGGVSIYEWPLTAGDRWTVGFSPALISPTAPSVCLSLARSQPPPRVSVQHPIVCDIQPQCENQQMGNFVCVGECGCVGMCVSVCACEGKRVGERELRSRE